MLSWLRVFHPPLHFDRFYWIWVCRNVRIPNWSLRFGMRLLKHSFWKNSFRSTRARVAWILWRGRRGYGIRLILRRIENGSRSMILIRLKNNICLNLNRWSTQSSSWNSRRGHKRVVFWLCWLRNEPRIRISCEICENPWQKFLVVLRRKKILEKLHIF